MAGSSDCRTLATSTSSMIVPLLIDGRPVVTSTTIDVTSPVTLKHLHAASACSVDEANTAVDAAQRAFPAWSAAHPTSRRDIFLRVAEIFERRTEEMWGYMYEETGAERPHFDFQYGSTIGVLKDIAGRLPALNIGHLPHTCDDGTSAMIVKEPYGVVLGIAPWNAPHILGVRAIAYALGVGNTVVFKGSELCPRTFWGVGDAFREAGLPDGCLNILFHRTEDAAIVTTTLIAHPSVKKISFTGSTAVGRIIAATAGKYLKPLLVELGGKAPALVLEDADVKLAAEQCCLGAFSNAGQICMSTERIIVHRSVYEPFKAALAAAFDRLYGATSPEPKLISAMAIVKSNRLVADAVAKGGSVLHGKLDTPVSEATRMRPVIVEGIVQQADLYHTESFGPTVSLFVVEDEEQAIALANDTEYGLSSAVFTEDLRRALRVAKRIESGAVHINSMSVHDEPSLPHGGVKQSGWGRFNAGAGLEEFLRTKTITWKD
ncbi:aldehyde dehydrogenase [Fistulina hepatica ATCC 64428]|uniref:Aldehyde dehydrogenase n=1 Tax=Fistulina hepatica ATCC 64428 TaxID=1128425 RepID=A0A0D7A1H1_9AGAR|nr:aldehyde dehydrogenase [Fistulina hepatica ATCC 64428]